MFSLFADKTLGRISNLLVYYVLFLCEENVANVGSVVQYFEKEIGREMMWQWFLMA